MQRLSPRSRGKSEHSLGIASSGATTSAGLAAAGAVTGGAIDTSGGFAAAGAGRGSVARGAQPSKAMHVASIHRAMTQLPRSFRITRLYRSGERSEIRDVHLAKQA